MLFSFNMMAFHILRVFALLERKPLIDTNPSVGLKIPSMDGNVGFADAEFSYPTRQNVKILQRLSLAIKSGQKVALVGESGCGKSTVIQVRT